MSQEREREIDRLPTAFRGRALHVAARERPSLIPAPAAIDEITASLTVAPSRAAPALDLASEIDAIDALLEPPRLSKEGVRIDPARGAPMTLESHYASVVGGCVERLSLFARQRVEKPLARLGHVEARMLSQIDALAEAGATPDGLLDVWREDGSPWTTWAIAFTLGCFDGRASAAALLDLVEALDDDAFVAARLAGDAIARAPHPGVDAWTRDAQRSRSPAARAAALELASIRGLLSPEAAGAALRDPNAIVAAAGARAVGRLVPVEGALVLGLGALLDHEDVEVAWEAASALSLTGGAEPVVQIRDQRPLAKRLGARALELLVRGGALADFEVMTRLAASLATTKETLDVVARFGHPDGRDYIVRHLDDEELGDHAAAALETLFGSLVASGVDEPAKAWRAALAGRVFDPAIRLRRGEPWSRRVVGAECASGRLSRRAVEGRLAELRVESRVQAHLDIGGFAPDAAPNLRAAIEVYKAR